MAASPEDELIQKHFAPLVGQGALGLADDAAVLSLRPGEELVVTKDMLVAGVHFFADDPPGSVAAKSLCVNLSDLAAKGAEPRGFLLGLGLPRTMDADARETWLGAFAAGLRAASAAAACPLLGGDTVSSPGGIVVSITAMGAVPAGRMVRRTGARPGDVLLVSGSIGDAALGLRLRLEPDAAWTRALGEEHRAYLLDRYLHPRPRNALAPLLLMHAHGAMDISDGLVGDCAKMLRVSGCAGRIAAENVPLSDAAHAAIALAPELLPIVLTGGDDYELLVSASRVAADALIAGASRLGLPLTAIGEAHEGESALGVNLNGEMMRFSTTAYSHV